MDDYRILDYTTWTPLQQTLDELQEGLMFLKDNRKRADIDKKGNGVPIEALTFETPKRILLEWTTTNHAGDQWLYWLPQPMDVIQMFPLGRDFGKDSDRQSSHDISDGEMRRWLSLLIMAVHESGWLLEKHPTALVVAPSQVSPEGEPHFHETSHLFGKIYQCKENGQLIRNQSLYMISEKHRPHLLRGPDAEWIEMFRDRWKKANLSSNLQAPSQLGAVIEHRYRLINWYDPNWNRSLDWVSFGQADVSQRQFSIQEESSLPSFLFVSWGPRQDPLEYLEWIRQKSWIISEELDKGLPMDSLDLTIPDTWGPSHWWKVVFRPIFYIRTPLKESLHQLWQASLTAAVVNEEVELLGSYRDVEGKTDEGAVLDSIRYILQRECYSRSLETPSQKDANQEESSFTKLPGIKVKVARPMTITYLLTRYLLNQCQSKSHRSQWLCSIRLWWQRLLRELRWHWEHRVVLCNLETPVMPDYQTPLVHQKFHLLQYCILQSKRQTSQETRGDYKKEVSDLMTSSQQADEEEIFFETVEEMSFEAHRGRERHGVQQTLSNILSQSTGNPLYIPATLDPGFKTEDQIEEDHFILSNLGSSPEAATIRARMQSGPLLSGKVMLFFPCMMKEKTIADTQCWHWKTHVNPDVPHVGL
jgi:hypothetical protein